MNLTEQTLPVPLRTDETGTIRVGSTRITLDLVITRFQEGATPEEIVYSYDTLRLEDIYLVLAYYLAHKEEVHAYLRQREEEAAAVRRKLETEGISQPGFWDDLKSRAAKRAEGHAAPAE
jgi:uncharacterized protein (DUF433 family)